MPVRKKFVNKSAANWSYPAPVTPESMPKKDLEPGDIVQFTHPVVSSYNPLECMGEETVYGVNRLSSITIKATKNVPERWKNFVAEDGKFMLNGSTMGVFIGMIRVREQSKTVNTFQWSKRQLTNVWRKMHLFHVGDMYFAIDIDLVEPYAM